MRIHNAMSKWGQVTRTTKGNEHVYSFCTVRQDGWRMFHKTESAAKKEYAYQLARHPGQVELCAVTSHVPGLCA